MNCKNSQYQQASHRKSTSVKLESGNFFQFYKQMARLTLKLGGNPRPSCSPISNGTRLMLAPAIATGKVEECNKLIYRLLSRWTLNDLRM